ncbi:MAG: hypothetical protein ACYS8W_11470 [Planctomycetota bacterium]|jgi:ATP-dependent helicase/nuclease subunit B
MGNLHSISLESLRGFAEQYPLEEKILMLPDYRIGEHYLTLLAAAAVPVINFHVVSPMPLAKRIVEYDLARENTEIVGSVGVQLAIERILGRLDGQGDLSYFSGSLHLPGVVEVIYRAVVSLREVGIAAKDITQRAFREKAKGKDIRLILGEYEKFLADENAIDLPGMLRMAIDKAPSFRRYGNARFAVFAEFPISGLQLKLLEKISRGRLVVLPHDPVRGLERPGRYLSAKDEEAADAFSHLFEPEKSTGTGSGEIECFGAIGITNEVREVFRRVLKNNIPFDDVEIVASDASAYLPVIINIGEYLGIPLTFGTGIPVEMTSPGRALRSFLDWADNGFSSGSLKSYGNGACADTG